MIKEAPPIDGTPYWHYVTGGPVMPIISGEGDYTDCIHYELFKGELVVKLRRVHNINLRKPLLAVDFSD
ncbi:hypothetical protein NVP1293O_52 [Vibrio phage 1.293.O._10N.261.52.E1]|nr:hypothetical protein NVP1293O_52 [Vibrio phage 1.293.O._10N.261.52.E1]